MSFTFDLIINPVIVLVVFIVGFVIGFMINKVQVAKVKAKLTKLEAEVVACNTETLESQRAYVALEMRLKDQSIPVIPMKKINGINTTKENNPKEKASK